MVLAAVVRWNVCYNVQISKLENVQMLQVYPSKQLENCFWSGILHRMHLHICTFANLHIKEPPATPPTSSSFQNPVYATRKKFDTHSSILFFFPG